MDTLEKESLKKAVSGSLTKALSSEAYEQLIELFAKEGKTTGPKQNEDLIYYTKLNAQRGRRIYKTWKLNDELVKKVKSIDDQQKWILITESWCGDAANAVPLIAQLASLNENVDLKIVLRDDNLPLMDLFLTNGGRSIPKLIALDADFNVLFAWGPRPAKAQKLYSDWKNDENRMPYREFQIVLQKWYNEDAGASMQEEFLKLIDGK